LQIERLAKDDEVQVDPGEAAQSMLAKFEKVMEQVTTNQKEIKSELSHIRSRLPAGSFVSRNGNSALALATLEA
jgi:hypothetical protein